MKNKLIKISGIIICLFYSIISYAQEGEAIYSYDGNNIVTKNKFVGASQYPDNYTNVTPYVFVGKEAIQSKNYIYIYWVNMYKYKGFEDEAGFCNVIDIVRNDKTLLQVKDPGGWEDINGELKNKYSLPNNHFILSRISNTAIALIFTGHCYDSTTPILTIIVIDKDKAALVYNKPMFPLELSQTADSFSLTVSSNIPEINGNGIPVTPYIKHKIWSENGVIRFKDL